MDRFKHWIAPFCAMLLVLSFLPFGVAPVSAAEPSIRLSVSEGAPGSSVKATLAGFSAGVAVRLRWDGSTIGRTTTNDRGRASITFTVPDATGGVHTVRANAGRVAVTAEFTVLPSLRIDPSTVLAGKSITFALKGFSGGERAALRLTVDGATRRLTTVSVNAKGSKTKKITIPGDLGAGVATIEARGATGTVATATLEITSGSLPTASPSLTATATNVSDSSPTPTPTPAATRTPTSTATSTATPRDGAVSIWVDPVSGNDDNSGSTRDQAVRTLAEAWGRVPMGRQLTNAYRIRLVAGTYSADQLPNYMEQRYGTESAPITIEAAGDAGTAVLRGSLNIFDVRYLSLIGLTLRTAGDVVHCELCLHFTISGSVLDGQGAAHETLKINQSQYVAIENSDLGGSYENAIDFVAVQHGHITNNLIHDAEDWCMYLKGGSADFWIEGNEIYNCGTGGFTAGQGTGFQFMTSPWLTYEVEDITFIRNEIHDTDGAGMGVNGGHNIVLAENHLVRIGARSHLLEIGFGSRSCDGQPGDEGRERCAQYLAAGGWGTTAIDNGDNYVRIPNKNVTVRDNVFENPGGYQSRWQHFFIPGPYSGSGQSGSNAPDPAYADDGLAITGNVIVNGDAAMSLGLGEESGCQPSNPTCNETQLYADNDINGR